MKPSQLPILALLLPLASMFGQATTPPWKSQLKTQTRASMSNRASRSTSSSRSTSQSTVPGSPWLLTTKGALRFQIQGGKGTFRLEVPKPGEAFDEGTITKLNVKSSQWGMLYAFDHLYMMGNQT